MSFEAVNGGLIADGTSNSTDVVDGGLITDGNSTPDVVNGFSGVSTNGMLSAGTDVALMMNLHLISKCRMEALADKYTNNESTFHNNYATFHTTIPTLLLKFLVSALFRYTQVKYMYYA